MSVNVVDLWPTREGLLHYKQLPYVATENRLSSMWHQTLVNRISKNSNFLRKIYTVVGKALSNYKKENLSCIQFLN